MADPRSGRSLAPATVRCGLRDRAQPRALQDWSPTTSDSYKVGGGTKGIDTGTRYSVTEKGSVKTTYNYDPIARLTNAKTRNGADTKTYRDYTYPHDRHSNMTRKTVTPR